MDFVFNLIYESQTIPFRQGVKFKNYNMVSIISVCAYILALIINGTIGVKTGKSTSDSYHLVVTPPPWAFSIWGIIFTTTLIALLWSIHTVSWSLETHLYFWLYCFTISVWILLWAVVSKITILLCKIVLILLTINIYLLWKSTLVLDNDDWSIYLMRGTIAFQLGWTSSAQCLNFCICLVHVFGVTQDMISKLVWICLIIAHSIYLCLAYFHSKQYNKNMLLNFGGYLLSMTWAIMGVAISYNNYSSGRAMNKLK
ncbi:unnamed protein product [Paramecium primaurelia]|uniref:Uncharacterized protein n=1 Tax=Paramecium primaurelia TaxID=5886 RepID=A0A8S1K694_PARPR|nr:unnamed protein product [Paramecium primaurelia]CAD8045908.1 unnamed protein product [Paramecium primaurelia]